MIRKRLLVFFLALLLLVTGSGPAWIFANSEQVYEPYSEEEFAPWLLDLRRAETLFIGSLPITYTVISLGFGLAGIGSQPLESRDYVLRLGSAAVLSMIIAVADYLLGLRPGER